MPAKVLLISANRCTTPDPVFPLGLAFMNAALRRAGHQTAWLDCLAEGTDMDTALATFQPDWAGISLRNIDNVCIRNQETFYGDSVALCRSLRRSSRCSIVLGGSGFSLFPERLLELTGADFGIRGEGEASLPALLAARENHADWRAIPGLVFRNGNGGIRVNPPAHEPPADSERTADWNSAEALNRRGIPPPLSGRLTSAATGVRWPFQEGLEAADRPEPLARHYLQSSGMLNVQTQRGCAGQCCYCTYPLIEGRQPRRRPPEVVAGEFARLEGLGARYAFIVDSVFNSSPDHVAAVCEALLRRKLKIKWGCFLRPQGLTAELVRLMAQAGLAHAEFGSDSLCEEVLRAYGKGLSFEDIRRANALARHEQIECCHYLICGGPGETLHTLEQTFENSRRLAGAVFLAVAGMRIYPGTPLHARALREGSLPAQADLLAPAYYVAPALRAEQVLERLRQFARLAPNWVVGDPAPAYTQLIQKLRRRGITGPLWGYFATLQRLWPQPPPAAG
jgi:radical SAM superfamily enzyme YgiQ (UPF0313 family)